MYPNTGRKHYCVYNNGTWGNWLCSDTVTVTGTFTKAQSASTEHLVIRQFGNVVSINGYLSGLTLNSNAETFLGTVSDVSMPEDAIRIRGAAGSQPYSVQNDAYFYLDVDGKLHVTCSGGQAVYLSISYVANL